MRQRVRHQVESWEIQMLHSSPTVHVRSGEVEAGSTELGKESVVWRNLDGEASAEVPEQKSNIWVKTGLNCKNV